LRVLHLTSSFPRFEGDASGVFVDDLADALVAAGVEVRVVAPRDARSTPSERVRWFGYGPVPLAHRGGLLKTARGWRLLFVPWFLAGFWWAARDEVRRWRPDVVHAHWWFPAGLVAALLGVPFVVTLHGSDVPLAKGSLGPLARWVFRRAALVAAVSETLAREAGVSHVLRMPLGVDVQPLDPAPLPVRVVAIGRNSPEKGFDLLRDLGVPVDIYGADTESLPGGHGPATRAELVDALAKAHALVVPSRREGLGLVALEAIALGRPVIATNVGGLPEVVEDGVDGILVAPDDVDALRAAVARLPLPSPGGAALARHLPVEVAARHLDAYVSVSARRS
jgi:glycosyltransferase involved in cell wall biosynthesis